LLRRTLNLGIVAHVDAGKTTLTERLLYTAGVIDEIGSVDKGTTQTDSLPLEQQRGITIKAAVVSFEVEDVTVNLIDTPGHPDFIAEVERVLNVLDGAVLVISAVEGVQPQTRVLMRALRRLQIPTLLFVNKMDRLGADFERVLHEIAERLTPAVIPLADPDPDALVEALAENDESLLGAYLDGESLQLNRALAEQAQRALVYPAFYGSAMKGDGVDALKAGITELLPSGVGDPEAPISATVFKIERGPGGEKVAYVRMFSGTMHARDAVADDKVTALAVFEHGRIPQRPTVSGRQIAKVWGLHGARIGDTIGAAPPRTPRREFPPPTLQSVVVPRDPGEAQQLRVAVAQLAEQDPLINVRDELGRELIVSLYGEVQKEVLEATLATDFGLTVDFRETTPIYVERPIATGEALEVLHAESNPFHATIGLRVDPATEDSGLTFKLDVDTRTIPLFVYKTRQHFAEQMERYVSDALREGLHGWQVVDCCVTMTRCSYSVADGPPSRRGPTSTAADFRKLTPLVLVQALERAGTAICEPIVRVSLEVPTRTVGAVLPALARLGAAVDTPIPYGELSTIEAVMPVTRTTELQRQLPELTSGEGVLDSTFAGYRVVSAEDRDGRARSLRP
jgi:ribosomal protection tetracycline resistance protein